MLNLRKLCADSHKISKDAGWLDKPRTNDEIVNLFVTEISEAFEEFRNNKRAHEVYYEVSYTVADVSGDAKIKAVMTGKEVQQFKKGNVIETKPCGIPVELADWIIRVAQYVGTAGLIDAFVTTYESSTFGMDESMTLSELCLELTKSSLKSFISQGQPLDVSYLAGGLILIEYFCDINKIPIADVVAEKEAFNKTRAYRHGGKRV